MQDVERKKLVAAAKIGFGGLRIASGVATMLGHGFLGGLTRSPGGARAVAPLVKRSLLGGKDMIQQGISEWKDASSS